MKSKLKNYLVEADGDKVYLDDVANLIGYSEKTSPSCLNCFYSLSRDIALGSKFAGRMTCENPDVFEAIAYTIAAGFSDFKGENPMKYHGQIDMMVHPQGKCKFWKKRRV